MKWLVYIMFFSTFQLYAQNVLKPFVQLSYFQTYTEHFALNELELGGGVQFNEYFSTQINFRGSIQRVQNGPSDHFKVASISIEPSYRILRRKYMFSPVIAYDGGIELANNGRDKFILNYVYRPYYQFPYKTFDKGLYYGKAKVLLSIQWKQLDFLLGATYSTYFFRFYKLEPVGPQTYGGKENKYKTVGSFIDGEFGFGFEASLKYTFPMKKRQAKKQAKQAEE